MKRITKYSMNLIAMDRPFSKKSLETNVASSFIMIDMCYEIEFLSK